MRSLLAVVLVSLAAPAFAQSANADCPPALRHRTPEQVLQDHFTNLATGNYAAERCTYARDAIVISDGGVTAGVENIVATLAGFGQAFGGQVPTVNQQVTVSILNDRTYMARTLFSLFTACVDIPDGTDTYIIRNGRIQAQTAHGTPVFKCGPPPGR